MIAPVAAPMMAVCARLGPRRALRVSLDGAEGCGRGVAATTSAAGALSTVSVAAPAATVAIVGSLGDEESVEAVETSAAVTDDVAAAGRFSDSSGVAEAVTSAAAVCSGDRCTRGARRAVARRGVDAGSLTTAPAAICTALRERLAMRWSVASGVLAGVCIDVMPSSSGGSMKPVIDAAISAFGNVASSKLVRSFAVVMTDASHGSPRICPGRTSSKTCSISFALIG
jgi:hypothetical protein